MDERVVKFRVGVMVLACLIILGIMVGVFGDFPAWWRGLYTIHIQFPEAPGVSQGTPVRKSGILIGRVTQVKFAEDGGVIVTVTISGDVRLHRNEIARITGSLLGDAIIEFVPSGEKVAGYIEDGELISGTVARNPLDVLSGVEGNLNEAIGSVSTAGSELGKLAVHLNELLLNNDEQIARIVSKTEKSLDAMNNLFGDTQLQEQLKSSLSELPAVLRETRTAINSFQKTVNLADRNLANLEGFTRPLGERGEQMVATVDETVGKLDELLNQFVGFGKALNSREGSLGQLINNPELYQNANAAVCNLEQLTKKLKPIVDDARVFSDKIARHPEVLGVRGAIKKSPGIK